MDQFVRRFFVRYVLLRFGMLSDAVDSGVNGIPPARVENKQGGRWWWNVQCSPGFEFSLDSVYHEALVSI